MYDQLSFTSPVYFTLIMSSHDINYRYALTAMGRTLSGRLYRLVFSCVWNAVDGTVPSVCTSVSSDQVWLTVK